jgi:hypothetical protein
MMSIEQGFEVKGESRSVFASGARLIQNNTTASSPVAFEQLEERKLLSWGAVPQLIDQDALLARYPHINAGGQTIVDLDTGINAGHPNLAGKVFVNRGEVPGNWKDDDRNGKVDDVSGWDFVENDNSPRDAQGHGTMTAGVMVSGRWTNNGNTRGYGGDRLEYQGIASGAKVLPLRIASGLSVNVYHVEAALKYVIANRSRFNITAVNMSLGFSASDNAKLDDELRSLTNSGVFIAFNGKDYTANTSQVNPSGSFSPRSARWSGVDVLAPGNQVPYLDLGTRYGLGGDGVSYAFPFVTAAGALVKQVNPGFSVSQIISILKDSGKSVGGYRLLDLDNAIDLAYQRSGKATAPVASGTPQAVRPPAPVQPPAIQPTSGRSAFNTIQAESLDVNKGVTRTSTTLSWVDPGDYVGFKGVNFGGGATKMTMNLGAANAYAGKSIDIRIGGASGRVVGSMKVNATGGWGIMRQQTVTLWAKITGVQDVYFTFRGSGGGVANIDWFKFSA